MKTTTIIIAALLLQVNILFANIDGVPERETKELTFTTSVFLAPVTPKEATFDETDASAEILIQPVTPKEATFEEETEELSLVNLAPVTPAEADFNDDDQGAIVLSPVTPIEADFDLLP